MADSSTREDTAKPLGLPRGLIVASLMAVLLTLQIVSNIDGLVAQTRPLGESGFSVSTLTRFGADTPARWQSASDLWDEAAGEGCDDRIVGQLCEQSTLQPARSLVVSAFNWDMLLIAAYSILLVSIWAWIVLRHPQQGSIMTGPWFLVVVGSAALFDALENIGGKSIIDSLERGHAPSSAMTGLVDWATCGKLAALAVVAGVAVFVLVRVFARIVKLKALARAALPIVTVVVVGQALVADQSLDTIRRLHGWQVGTTAASLVLLTLVAMTVIVRGLDGQLPATVIYGSRRHNLVWTIPSIVIGLTGLVTDSHGLYALAAVLLVISLISTLLDPAPQWLEPTDALPSWEVCLGVLVLGIAILPRATIAAVTSEYYSQRDTTPWEAFTGQGWKIVLSCLGGLALAVAAPRITDGMMSATKPNPRTIAIIFGILLAAPTIALVDPDWSATVAPELGAPLVVVTFAIVLIALFGALRELGLLLRGDAVAVKRWRYPTVFERLGARQPTLGILVVVWLIASAAARAPSYHDVQTAKAIAIKPLSVDQAVNRWYGSVQHQTGFESSALPMVIVSASGGGIRAAYWTAAVLSCAIEADGAMIGDTGIFDPCAAPVSKDVALARASHLFMASGISGGSLGLVAVDARLDQLRRTDIDVPVDPDWYKTVIDNDYLSPTLARWFFGDIPNQFLRRSHGVDRARALERSWEAEWTGRDLDTGFYASQSDATGPVLLLNSYSAEDGCRLNVSIIQTNTDTDLDDCKIALQPYAPGQVAHPLPTLNATNDLLDFADCLKGEVDDDQFVDFRRSTAALLSARFPFVTPAGRIGCSTDVTYAVDGGYRESTGASPLVELWPEIDAAVSAEVEGRQCIVPMFVQLNNGYIDAPIDSPDPEMSDLLIPIKGQSNAAGGVGDAAKIGAQRIFTTLSAGTPFEMSRFQQISTYAHRGIQAPLGWVLSPLAADDLSTQLLEPANAEPISKLRAWMDGGTNVVPFTTLPTRPMDCDAVPLGESAGPPTGSPAGPGTPPAGPATGPPLGPPTELPPGPPTPPG